MKNITKSFIVFFTIFACSIFLAACGSPKTNKQTPNDNLERIVVWYAEDSTNRFPAGNQLGVDITSDFYITSDSVNCTTSENEFLLNLSGTIKRNLMSLSTVQIVTIAYDTNNNLIAEKTTAFGFTGYDINKTFELILNCGNVKPKYYKLYLSW